MRLLNNAEKRPAEDAILSLKLSDNQIGHAGALGIAEFLRHDITQKALIVPSHCADTVQLSDLRQSLF